MHFISADIQLNAITKSLDHLAVAAAEIYFPGSARLSAFSQEFSANKPIIQVGMKSTTQNGNGSDARTRARSSLSPKANRRVYRAAL